MKKLIVTLAAVVVAAGVQAATINWGCGQATDWNAHVGKVQTTMSVYLIDSDYIDTIKTAINNGTIGNINSDTGMFATQGVIEKTSFANTRGSIAAHNAPTPNHLVYDKGLTTYDFALLVIDDVSTVGETWYNISKATEKAAFDPSKTSEFAEQKFTFSSSALSDANSQTGGWQMASVPEPTSAMLLLLGMAGLALRRRRA